MFKNRKYLEILIKSTINVLKGHQISNSGSDKCFRSVSTVTFTQHFQHFWELFASEVPKQLRVVSKRKEKQQKS